MISFTTPCGSDSNQFKTKTPKAIHSDRNCREYQDDLAAGDANGIISGQRRSEQAIQDLIDRNEAMKCFKCGVIDRFLLEFFLSAR